MDVSGFSLEDIGGAPEVVKEIEALIRLVKNPKHFSRFGLYARAPRGVLLEGPPGTGKTLSAKIIASELGIPFYEFSSADLKSVWVGESPKIVRAIFESVERPCVIFFDEFDAIGIDRGFASSIERDIEQELLKGMDGLNTQPGIMVLAATNSAELLDPAIKRAGRFDRKIHIDLPNKTGRYQILRIHFNKSQRDLGENICALRRQCEQ